MGGGGWTRFVQIVISASAVDDLLVNDLPGETERVTLSVFATFPRGDLGPKFRVQSHPPELSDHQNVQNFTPDSIFIVLGPENTKKEGQLK